jgi:hypothetical protein
LYWCLYCSLSCVGACVLFVYLMLYKAAASTFGVRNRSKRRQESVL